MREFNSMQTAFENQSPNVDAIDAKIVTAHAAASL
jgi:t-SNARE complex subunit (syntaxin)